MNIKYKKIKNDFIVMLKFEDLDDMVDFRNKYLGTNFFDFESLLNILSYKYGLIYRHDCEILKDKKIVITLHSNIKYFNRINNVCDRFFKKIENGFN